MASTDWHPADITAALHKRGVSMHGLSLDAGYSPWTLRDALRRPYPKAEAIIAEAIGVPPQSIWPSRYDEQGRHRGGSATRVKPSTPAAPRHPRSRRAA
jgi:Ner family transcriptional regulator